MRGYYVGLIRLLDRKGLCAAYDGEELAVKSSNDFSDQYKVLTSWNEIHRIYMVTCTPAVFPLERASPAPSPAGCCLAPSVEVACDRTYPRYPADVETAIDQVLTQNPELFDLSQTTSGSDWPVVRDLAAYHPAVVEAFDRTGYCGKFDGEEIQLKRSNETTEHYDVNYADRYVRPGPASTARAATRRRSDAGPARRPQGWIERSASSPLTTISSWNAASSAGLRGAFRNAAVRANTSSSADSSRGRKPVPSRLSSRRALRYSSRSASGKGRAILLTRSVSTHSGASSPFQRGSGLRPASTHSGRATAMIGSPGSTHRVAMERGSARPAADDHDGGRGIGLVDRVPREDPAVPVAGQRGEVAQGGLRHERVAGVAGQATQDVARREGARRGLRRLRSRDRTARSRSPSPPGRCGNSWC